MGSVGIGPEDQDRVFALLAAVLHLGNARFVSSNASGVCCVCECMRACVRACALAPRFVSSNVSGVLCVRV